jgi:L-histidine Nalpha-methyltransferase
VKDEATLV